MDMAPKKKDDVEKAKEEVAKSARAVGEAAKALQLPESSGRPLRDVLHFGEAEEDWDHTIQEIENLDRGFSREEAVNKLKQKFEQGDVSVRVMQIGPDGKLTDVSDKISPKDVRSDQIAGIASDGRDFGPRTPQGRAAALRLLQDLLPGFRPGMLSGTKNSTTNSIRKMEETLNESDKILEHWKK